MVFHPCLRRSTHQTSTNESWPCFVTSRTRQNAEQRGQKQQPGKTQESCFRPLIFSMAIWLDDQQATFTAPACMLFCIRENTNCCPCTEMPLSIARKVKEWCQEARQDEVIVQVDLRIAFNSGSQRALAESEGESSCPVSLRTWMLILPGSPFRKWLCARKLLWCSTRF